MGTDRVVLCEVKGLRYAEVEWAGGEFLMKTFFFWSDKKGIL